MAQNSLTSFFLPQYQIKYFGKKKFWDKNVGLNFYFGNKAMVEIEISGVWLRCNWCLTLVCKEQMTELTLNFAENARRRKHLF